MLNMQDFIAVLGLCLAAFKLGYSIGYKIAKK